MSGRLAGTGRERALLRRISQHPRVPGAVREAVRRLESSDIGYRLAHGAFWSLAGTLLARVLTLAASVVTARVLGKAGYGELGVLTSTLMTFQAFAGLGLGMTATRFVADLRVKDPERAGRVLALSSFTSVCTGLIATVALWVAAPWLAVHAIDAPGLVHPLRIAAIGLVFTTLGGAQTGALAGMEAFRTMTAMNVWAGIAGVPVAVAGVWFWGLEGAVWATVVTAALQWGITHFALRSHARQARIPIRLGGWWRERRILWSYSLPALAQGIMVTPVTWAASALLVNQPRGYLEMGALSAANQWFGAVMFLPNAVGGAILPVLSERLGSGDAAGARKVLKAAVALNALAVAPFVALGSLASPWIMRAYGPTFADAWPTLIAVLATAAVVAATNPVGSILAASDRLWLGFLMNTGWATVFLGSTVLLVRWGALGVASARLIGYLVHAGWTAWYAVRFVRRLGTAAP